MKPARITEMAFAPTAGANGVELLEPTPIAQAIKRLAVAATTIVMTVPGSTIYAFTPCTSSVHPSNGARGSGEF